MRTGFWDWYGVDTAARVVRRGYRSYTWTITSDFHANATGSGDENTLKEAKAAAVAVAYEKMRKR